MSVAYTSFEFIYYEYTKYILGSISYFDKPSTRETKKKKPKEQEEKKIPKEEIKKKEKKKEKEKEKEKEIEIEMEIEKEKGKKEENNNEKDRLNLSKKLILSQQRLISHGFRIGRRLAEMYSIEVPRLVDDESRLRFIGKNFWKKLFGKKINSLRTNHKGIWMLQDNEFKLLNHLSFPFKRNNENQQFFMGGMKIQNKKKMEKNNRLKTLHNSEEQEFLQRYLSLFIGILQGAISNLGIQCKITINCNKLPNCSFTIEKITNNIQGANLQEPNHRKKN
ncbi:trafficking protein particle complex subunit 6b [Anaeramoeba flamelloides]|uniref:Trafficking protein particle complex subunit 6b n=1 Tax=Anaeramoeba flamelloides TaxID=1746091 RepID=A0ABQ8Y4E2_9EUKA|nr:trafficking protein particle complex subunit 6b [Anaeramoeba flamelloides]